MPLMLKRKKGGVIQHIDLSTDPLEQVLKDVEVIFHCAAQPGISSTTPFFCVS